MGTRIVVLFNLRPGVDVAEYERWALASDLPVVRRLPSVEGFDVRRVTGLLGSDESPPYAYVEVLDVTDMDGLFADIGTPAMQAIAQQFQAFADNPQFLVTTSLEEPRR